MEQVATLALPLPPAEGPDALERLLTRAPSADPHFADAVTRALKALPAYSEQEKTSLGPRLLGLIDSGRLRGLVGSDSNRCEAFAAKRLLELGYPWALHLTPQQLEGVRELQGPPRPRPSRTAFLGSAVATGLNALPLLISWLMWISESTLAFRGLFQALSLGVVVVNLLFVLGRLERRFATLAAVAGLAASWFAFELSNGFDSGLWGWELLCWAITLLASRVPGPDGPE